MICFGMPPFYPGKRATTSMSPTLWRHDMNRLSNRDLTARLYSLRGEERALLVDFLGHLGELDARGAHLAAGFGSCFAFCTDSLGLTRSSAHRRVAAAR